MAETKRFLRVRLLFVSGSREDFLLPCPEDFEGDEPPAPVDVQAMLSVGDGLRTAEGERVSWDADAVQFMGVSILRDEDDEVLPTDAPPHGVRCG